MKEIKERPESAINTLVALVAGALAALVAFALYIVSKAKNIVNEGDKPK